MKYLSNTLQSSDVVLKFKSQYTQSSKHASSWDKDLWERTWIQLQDYVYIKSSEEDTRNNQVEDS